LRNEKLIGWYWFCISKFEGVLPPKCWQRSIRLRKSNIQIGEADCLSNRKRGESLWREDRGNNYFLGEIHALDEDLIPNSRRDYFNQNDACRRFEIALQAEFLNLHQLYHDASEIRSAYSVVRKAGEIQTTFTQKEKKGIFYDQTERNKAKKEVEEVLLKADKAKRKIEIIKEKLIADNAGSSPMARIVDIYKGETRKKSINDFEPDIRPQKGFVKDEISKHDREVLNIVFNVLKKMLPEDEAMKIREEIIKRFTRK
jgi:molecular chaperone HtpG